MHPSPGLRELHGAVADADDVYTFLHKTLRVPDNRIKNLRNEEATGATIEMEIKNLGGNPTIKEDDQILIYYAGHGAEAKAPSEWISANKIQMLVPHDFNPSGSDDSKRGQGVLDVRLAHLLQDVAEKKSDNIVRFLFCFRHVWYLTRYSDRPSFLIVVTLPRAREQSVMILPLSYAG